MKAAICEDEKIYSDFLRKYIVEFFRNAGLDMEIAVYSDGAPLIEACERGESYDIIFLDIQLEASDGVEVARRLRACDKETALIFVTGLENRMVEGYEVSALDYVVKTDLEGRLHQALERFMESRRTGMLTVPMANGDTAVLRYGDILWIESEGRGTMISTREGEVHSPLPVGRVAADLSGDRFIEIHKSVYVQIQDIRRIGADTVEMRGGKLLPLSRRKRKQVMSAVMAAVKVK